MPLISVITPVYNAETTLCQCVDSLLAQHFTDFELILVDDGSRDTSFRICDDYAAIDSRIKVLHKHNGGVSSARNLGLQYARGTWVTFVDSDDWVDDDFFPALEQDVDIVFGSYRNVVDGAPFSTFDATVMCDLALGSLAQHFCADSILRCPWAKFYRREVLGPVRFPEDMKVGEDTCFVFQYLARCQSFAVAPQSTYVVRAISPDEHCRKYALGVDYAVNSLQHLHESFEQMRAHFDISRRPFRSYIGYFKHESQDEWRKNPSAWYNNRETRRLYKYVWPDLSLTEKIRLMAAFVLKK